MELKVYNAEKFDRTKIWYAVFCCIFIVVIVASIFKKNIVWTILMFFLLWAYIYYWLINIHEITININENWLLLEKIIPRTSITWFCLEVELDKNKNIKRIKNIVFIYEKWHSIHTINDTPENLSAFVDELSRFIPLLESYPQTSREKFMRKIKL